MNYSFSLRTKEEKMDNVGFESSKPALVIHGQGSQDSNNVKTKNESSGVLRETVASTMREPPTSSKSSSSGSGSSNPMSIHPRTKSIYIKKNVKLPVLKGRFQNQLERNSQTRIGSIALYLGSFKTRFEICKDENGELRYIRSIQGHSGGMIISPRLMNYVMILHRWKQVIYHVGRARDQYSKAEAGLMAGEKERKEGRQTIFSTPLDPVIVRSTRCWFRILAYRF